MLTDLSLTNHCTDREKIWLLEWVSDMGLCLTARTLTVDCHDTTIPLYHPDIFCSVNSVISRFMGADIRQSTVLIYHSFLFLVQCKALAVLTLPTYFVAT